MRNAHVTRCLDNAQGLQKSCSSSLGDNAKRSTIDLDIIYLDEKDSDFVSPGKMPPAKRIKSSKMCQGTLSVTNNGTFAVSKPLVESASDVGNSVKVEAKLGNLDCEIASLRETLGNIDEKIAALEKMKVATMKDLQKKLKQKAQLSAKRTVLVGSERRPLQAVLRHVFHNLQNLSTMYQKSMAPQQQFWNKENQSDTAPLWELSKQYYNDTALIQELNVIHESQYLAA